MTPTGENLPEQRKFLRRQVDTVSRLNKIGTLITLVLTMIALIFSLGVNYQKLSSVSDTLSQFIKHADEVFVRKDVQSPQIANLDFQIRMLQEQVDVLSAEVRAMNSAYPTPPNPRFPHGTYGK
jgi:cell division protein FtsL